MNKPLLQIALDNQSIEQAIHDAKKAAKNLDVIEVGTILLAAEGKKAISELKKAFPDKIIIADGKIADAGSVFATMFFESGADFITCICAAETPTIASALQVAIKKPNRDVQIEMTTHYTWKQIEEWKKAGVKQIVYHRSRDSQASGVEWSEGNLAEIKKLVQEGFKVSITGGITKEDVKFFKGLPIYIFIAGRSIRDAKDPEQAAAEFQAEIKKYW